MAVPTPPGAGTGVPYLKVVSLDRGYLHALPNAPTSRSDFLYKLYEICQRRGVNLESLYAHYATSVSFSSSESIPNSEAAGRIHILGYVNSSSTVSIDTLQALNGSIAGAATQPFIGPITTTWVNNSYGVYIGSWMPFDTIYVTVSTPGGTPYSALSVLVPAGVDSSGRVTQWKEATVLENTTVNAGVPFRQSGYIRIGWQDIPRATLPIDLNCAPFESSLYLPMYWVRLFCAWSSMIPQITGWKLEPWVRVVGSNHVVYGWNPALDTDKDGYLNDSEYSAGNPRFWHMARCSIGFNSSTGRNPQAAPSFSLIRYWDETTRRVLAEAYSEYWCGDRFNGHGFEDVDATIQCATSATLRDYLDSSDVSTAAWANAQNGHLSGFAQVIRERREERTWSGGVLSQGRQLIYEKTHLRGKFDVLVRRNACYDYTGAFGTLGFCRQWDIFADAAVERTGHDNLSMIHCVLSLPSILGNTQQAWDRAKRTTAAQYMLRFVPEKTVALIWTADLEFQDGLTTTSNYWKAGVPPSMAYPPIKLLAVDIGSPTTIPAGYFPLPLVHPSATTDTPTVGDTTSSSITVDTVPYSVVPSNVFLLYPQASYSGQTDLVLARMFSGGIVVLRVRNIQESAPDSTYLNSTLTVNLPGGTYRQINLDGTLGPSTTSITLYGADGAILKKV